MVLLLDDLPPRSRDAVLRVPRMALRCVDASERLRPHFVAGATWENHEKRHDTREPVAENGE